MAHRAPDGPRAPKETFSLKAWLGTAVHFYLAHLIKQENWPATQIEFKFTIGEIKGYGTVRGHSDLYVLGAGTVVDHKTSDLVKIKSYQKFGAPLKYIRQGNLYGYGLELLGRPVTEILLFFIPRDSNSVSDIWACIVPYDRQIALDAMKRAKRIWRKVEAGQVETLSSDADCWVCRRNYRDVEFVGEDA